MITLLERFGFRGSRPACGAASLVAICLAACSSTTKDDVGGPDVTGGTGGGSASGGSAAGGDGGRGGTATGGAQAAGGAACDASLVPDLHASCIEDLGEGRLRISYDFSLGDQALDWSPSVDGTVDVASGALVVEANASSIGVAIFRKLLRVERLSFDVVLLAGNTTNFYLNTLWTGTWNPNAGYGGYHDQGGRGFIINGTEYSPGDPSPVSVGDRHRVVIEHSATEISWSTDGAVITEPAGAPPVNDRVLALGAWDSSAAFYDVVFEGTLDAP